MLFDTTYCADYLHHWDDANFLNIEIKNTESRKETIIDKY